MAAVLHVQVLEHDPNGGVVRVGADYQAATDDYALNVKTTIGAVVVAEVDGLGTAGAPVGGVLTVQGDPAGTPVPVSGNVGRSAQVVSPDPQVSTDAFVDVAGSSLDTINNLTASYTVKNTDGANSIIWQTLAGNASDFSDASIVDGPHTLAAVGVGSYAANPAPWRYYKAQVKSLVALTPGTIALHGVAKG